VRTRDTYSTDAPLQTVVKYWNINWAAAEAPRDRARSLLLVYLALMITGDLIAHLIGPVIERSMPAASLPAFLAMYFLFLWVAWVLAVRPAQPKARLRQRCRRRAARR
jgi:hypothetical protein